VQPEGLPESSRGLRSPAQTGRRYPRTGRKNETTPKGSQGYGGNSLEPANCSSQVLVKPVTPLRADQRPSVLGRANPVVVEAMVRRAHGLRAVCPKLITHGPGQFLQESDALAPVAPLRPPGCRFLFSLSGGIVVPPRAGLLNPRTFWQPFGLPLAAVYDRPAHFAKCAERGRV
jgi:hypothetical protein